MNDKERSKLTTKTGVRGNVRYITITDNIEEHWDSIISIGKSSYTWWAYIFHDKDDTEKHLHILLYDEGGTTLSSHAKRFSSVVPSNFIEKVWSPRAMARYLVHKDNPEKHQYSTSEVFSNSKDKFFSFLKENNSDCLKEYNDLTSVLEGKMSPSEFLEKYRGEFASMPFHHKLNVYSKLARRYL